MIKSMKNRRTVRSYTEKPISESLLSELLETACRASNTGNMQLYSVIVTRDEEQKKKLAPTHFNQPQVMSAPVILTFCADIHRYDKWCQINGTESGTDNFLFYTNAAIDTTILTQSFCTAAEDEGLGICYLGTTLYNAKEIAEILNCPEGVIPICTISLGYPAETSDKQLRLPLNAIVHDERYQDFSDVRIKEVYKETDEDPTNKKFVRANKRRNLAEVFTQIRYAKKDSEFFSDKFLRLLKEGGFIK